MDHPESGHLISSHRFDNRYAGFMKACLIDAGSVVWHIKAKHRVVVIVSVAHRSLLSIFAKHQNIRITSTLAKYTTKNFSGIPWKGLCRYFRGTNIW